MTDTSEVTTEESLSNLNDLRSRVLADEEILPEEYERVVNALRKTRKAGEARASTKKQESAAATQALGADLFSKIINKKI